MKTLNRTAVVVKPKEPFLKWAQSLSEPGDSITLDELQREGTVYLIPEFGSDQKTKDYLGTHFHAIFENQLIGWYQEETDWPQNRTLSMFWEWFEVEIDSEVMDLADEALEVEEL